MAFQLEIHMVLALSYWGQRRKQLQGRFGKIWKFVPYETPFPAFWGTNFAGRLNVMTYFLEKSFWGRRARESRERQRPEPSEKNLNLDPLKCHFLHLRGILCLLTKLSSVKKRLGATLTQHIFTNAEEVSNRKEGPAKFWNLDPLKRNFLHFRGWNLPVDKLSLLKFWLCFTKN